MNERAWLYRWIKPDRDRRGTLFDWVGGAGAAPAKWSSQLVIIFQIVTWFSSDGS